LIGEPTDFQMLRMHNGHAAFRIIATGIDGHSSKPDLGANAIQLATHALVALEELGEELRNERKFEDELERPYVVINPGIIQGGSAVNVIPAKCEVTVGYRPLPGQSAEDLFERFRQRVQERLEGYLQRQVKGARVELVLDRVSPPMLTPRGTKLEGILREVAASHQTGGCPFCTDAGNLERLGVQSMVFGPGSIDQAHRPDEYIEASQLTRGVEVVEQVVRAWCL
jgi:acetylornithine deacetylase